MNKYLFISIALGLSAISTIIFSGLSHKIDLKSTLFATKHPDFDKYWYQGKAEISSYTLEQSRYGEVHPGDAVLVFVTEDFSKKQQVKLDQPERDSEDVLKVLKLNYIKKFTTGIYDYSILNSVFTPVNYQQTPNTPKTTTSSQEWCGHTFTQLNLENQGYRVQAYSYFESEGDQNYYLEKTWLEDEIWNLIRIAPDNLPQGKFNIIPSTIYARLAHKKLELQSVEGYLGISEANPQIQTYTLVYPQFKRELKIHFEKKFPHKILSWEESYPSPAWNTHANILTTRATLKKTILLDYWNKHSLEDTKLREDLGLKN